MPTWHELQEIGKIRRLRMEDRAPAASYSHSIRFAGGNVVNRSLSPWNRIAPGGVSARTGWDGMEGGSWVEA